MVSKKYDLLCCRKAGNAGRNNVSIVAKEVLFSGFISGIALGKHMHTGTFTVFDDIIAVATITTNHSVVVK